MKLLLNTDIAIRACNQGFAVPILFGLFLWLGLAANGWALGGKVIVQGGLDRSVELTAPLHILADEQHQVTLEDILSGRVDEDFSRFADRGHTLGYRDVTYWLAFEIEYRQGRSNQAQEYFLRNTYALLDEIDIYFIRPGGEITSWSLGELRPFDNNRFAFPRPIASVLFNDDEQIQVFVRIRSAGSKIIHLFLDSETSIHEYMLIEGTFLAAFYSVMIAMVFYNFFVFLAVRQIAYFFYVLALSSFCIAQACLDGLPWATQLFDRFWTNQFFPTMIFVTWFAMAIFVRSFMITKSYAPVADIALKIAILAFAYWACLGPVVDYNTYVQMGAQVTVINCFLISLLGAYVWYRGNQIAAYFMFAWLVYMAGAGIFIFNSLGVADNGWFGLHSSQLGALGNVLLLSLALAHNINKQRRALQQAKRSAERSRNEMLAAKDLAQLNLQRFQTIWENAREGIYQCTLDGRFISANPRLAEVLGFDSNQDLVESVRSIGDELYASPEDRHRFERALIQQDQVSDFEVPMRRRDGSTFWSSSSAHIVRDEAGQAAYIEGTLVDITERIERERAEREREAAEATTAAKSEFLANMSHEIRTPMNAIMGFTELLLRSELKEKQREFLTKINSSSRNLLNIINDILDFSKIEAGRLQLEEIPFNLREVADSMMDMFAARAMEKSLEFSVLIESGTPVALKGDPLRLGQVLINLIGNAIKFTSRGEVALIIGVESRRAPPYLNERDGLGICFRVLDTGVGIPEDDRNHLFTPFTQADGSTTRKFGGTGLGLTISQQLVELMGGDIEVESHEGEGSEFRFCLALAMQGESPVFEGFDPDLKEKHVLLVDEPDTCRDTTVHTLRRLGCQVSVFEPGSGSSLETVWNSDPYDLLWIDHRLQQTRSEELIEWALQNDLQTKLLVSAFGRESNLISIIGGNDLCWLEKPASEDRVHRAVRSAFGLVNIQLNPESDLYVAGRFQHLRGARVLVVEDTFFNQELALELLEEVGITAETAENGEIALERLSRNTYDAVLMDCQMPVMDGYEATRQIRSHPDTHELPVIAMTANAMARDRQKCLECGMNDFVTKPIDPERLYRALDDALAGRDQIQSAVTKVPPSTAEHPELNIEMGKALLRSLDLADPELRRLKLETLKRAAIVAQEGLLLNAIDEATEAMEQGDRALEPLFYRIESLLTGIVESQPAVAGAE